MVSSAVCINILPQFASSRVFFFGKERYRKRGLAIVPFYYSLGGNLVFI